MKKEDALDALARLKAPAPDPEARLRAKRAAVAAFERAQIEAAAAADADPRKASAPSPRPSRDDNHGRHRMNWFVNRGWLAGAAGVCVVALGLTMVWPNLTRDRFDVGDEAAVRATPMMGSEVGDSRPLEQSQPLEQSPPVSEELHALDAPDEASTSADPAEPAAVPAPSTEARRDLIAGNGLAKAAEEAEANRRAQPPAPPVMPAAAPAAPPPAAEYEEQIVAGTRARLQSAMQAKREALSIADSVSAIGAERDLADAGRDRFENFDANPVRRVLDEPLSTFSADVDTASYSFVRRQLNAGRLPQKDAVRAEEMINYFDYAWPAARSRDEPFRPTVVVSDSPWNAGRKLVHVGIKGYELRGETPDANLVLLLDVSGSMESPDKLPLVVRSMEMLLDTLKPTDTVAIVVYAGAAGTVLEPTPVREKERIVTALRTLRAGGSTAGAQGIERAYELAERHFRKEGVNRIVLATDGDFNVGINGTEELKGYVERQRAKGIYLSVLGFGQGNYRDELAQALAQNGNGVAAYIDTENEARKVLVEEASSSLFPIASDVKFQVEFNPATVAEYRLVGYETRALRNEDFNNDAVDAGDIGAGHAVTAIYEITPVGVGGSIDEPRYERNRRETDAARGSRAEYGFVKIRYKRPGEGQSRLISTPIPVRDARVPATIERDVAFSTAVAGFAQLLRGGAYTGALSYDDVIRQAQGARGEDRFGYRAEFIELVRKAKSARGM